MKNLTANPVVLAAPTNGVGQSCALIAQMGWASLSKCSGLIIPFSKPKTTVVSLFVEQLAKKYPAQFMKIVPLLVGNSSPAAPSVGKLVLVFSAKPLRKFAGGSGGGGGGDDNDKKDKEPAYDPGPAQAAMLEKQLAAAAEEAASQRAWETQQARIARITQQRLAKQAIHQQNKSDARAEAIQRQQAEAEAAQQAKEDALRATALAEAQQKTVDATARTTADAAAQAAGQQASGNTTPSVIANAKLATADQTAPGLTPFNAALATSAQVGNQYYTPGNLRFGGA